MAEQRFSRNEAAPMPFLEPRLEPDAQGPLSSPQEEMEAMRAMLEKDGMENVEFSFKDGSEEISGVVYRKPGHQR